MYREGPHPNRFVFSDYFYKELYYDVTIFNFNFYSNNNFITDKISAVGGKKTDEIEDESQIEDEIESKNRFINQSQNFICAQKLKNL